VQEGGTSLLRNSPPSFRRAKITDEKPTSRDLCGPKPLIAAFGLVLVGTVFPGLAIFVYPNMLKIPAVPVDNEVFQNTEINQILHVLLAIGSVLGVVTLPIWSLLTGAKLLGKEHAESPTTL
jgi:hypothetical protein